ncbi:TonB family protein [Celeribacter baekdonensis]|nr:TonB family protein [Celeribacter baekdonensis]
MKQGPISPLISLQISWRITARIVRGTVGTAQNTTTTDAQIHTALSRWGGTLRAAIEHKKRYPSAAAGAKGSVMLQITVTRNGQIARVTRLGTSGNAALDRAAIKAVLQVGKIQPTRPSLARATYTFEQKISVTQPSQVIALQAERDP